MLNIHGFDLQRALKASPGELCCHATPEAPPGSSKSCTHSKCKRVTRADLLNTNVVPTEHDPNVTSVSLDQGAPRHLRTVRMGELDFELLQDWINRLVQESGNDIFRMKGILAIKHAQDRFVYHAVHMMFSGDFGEPWGDEPRVCKLVFIGKNLDQAALVEGFNACLATPENVRKKSEALRFAIGDKVECNTGAGWSSGTVVALMYRDDRMPPGMVAPYQIELDEDGAGLIWAPKDHECVIRAVGGGCGGASPESRRTRRGRRTKPEGHNGHAH